MGIHDACSREGKERCRGHLKAFTLRYLQSEICNKIGLTPGWSSADIRMIKSISSANTRIMNMLLEPGV